MVEVVRLGLGLGLGLRLRLVGVVAMFWLRMGFGLRFVSELGWGLGLGLDFCLCFGLELCWPCRPCGGGSGWGLRSG